MIDRVEAKQVSRVYGRQRALARTDFVLRRGEACALLGPNGAGKSTLCAIVSTVLKPTTGEVRFGGERASAQHRAAIGRLAHDPLCYLDLTAVENLRFFARIYGVADAEARIPALLERVGLADEARGRLLRTYSRGMLQRASLARALLHRPALLVLDEPFTGLDRAGVDTLAGLLREERARGTMLLVVTHDLDAVAGIVDRALVLQRGRMIHDGPAPADPDGMRALYRRIVDGEAGEAARA